MAGMWVDSKAVKTAVLMADSWAYVTVVETAEEMAGSSAGKKGDWWAVEKAALKVGSWDQ